MSNNTCLRCSKPAETKCSRCKITYYCSRECQKGNWKQHKSYCKAQICDKKRDEVSNEKVEGESLIIDEMVLRVKVDKSIVHGNGVFATKPIHLGEKICYFKGESKDANVCVKMQKFPDGTLSIKDSKTVFNDHVDKGKHSYNSICGPNQIIINIVEVSADFAK